MTLRNDSDDWQRGNPGVELRQIDWLDPRSGRTTPIIVVRLAPEQLRFRVGYDPTQPRILRAWFLAEQPLLAVNAGFFTPSFESTALVVQDGVVSGTSYQGFGGMFSVDADGQIRLRSLRDEPYDSSEVVLQGFQSFPMLVMPGGVVAPIEEDGLTARRTVLAQDRVGHVLVIVSPTAQFSLRGMAEWLVQSDLEIDRALNLDGGSSTGLILSDGALQAEIDSFTPLPLVLLVDAN
ncbi:MAG TPA: phosphodiester glycosidase family protein [Roseiflexaceae bacterium]|nr:phosphodiester glycosidase family protein [Roseiflexaceae bacterium]